MSMSRNLHPRTILLLMTFLMVAFFAATTAMAQEEPDLIPRKNAPPQTQPTAPETGPADASTAPASAPAAPSAFGLDAIPISVIVVGLLLGGFILLLIEVAVIPGFGIVGIKGLILIFVGLTLAFWKLDSRTAVLYTMISFAALIGMSLWFVFIFPHTRLGKRFILQTRISNDDGYSATQDLSRYVGQEGITTSDLRPSGIARIGDDRVDVMSDGDFIPKGTKIKAVRFKNGNVVVVPQEVLPPPPTA